jgi:hypothetical protein
MLLKSGRIKRAENQFIGRYWKGIVVTEEDINASKKSLSLKTIMTCKGF